MVRMEEAGAETRAGKGRVGIESTEVISKSKEGRDDEETV